MNENGKNERLDSLEKVLAWATAKWPDEYEVEWLRRHFTEGTEDAWWRWREELRFRPGVGYKPVHWLSEILTHEQGRLFQVHRAQSDPMKIAYTPSEQYGRQDRQIVTSVGKFLKKNFPGMSDDEIRDYTDHHRILYGAPTVHFAFGADDIEEVYENGPDSCMSGKDHWRAEKPYRIYDGPDTALAFLRRPDNSINARCIVRLDQTPMQYGRVYGDVVLGERLENLGFTKTGDLDGARLRLEETGDGEIVCPYIDGSSKATVLDGFLLIGDGSLQCQCTHGFVEDPDRESDNEDEPEGYRCSHCEDWYEGDPEYHTWTDEPLCYGCRDASFVYAYCNTYGSTGLVHEDEVIYVESTDEYYRDAPSVLRALNIVCDVHGDHQHQNDCTFVDSENEWYPDDEVCQPKYRDEYYPQSDCTQTADGEWVHDDDLTFIDGVAMHSDDVPEEAQRAEAA